VTRWGEPQERDRVANWFALFLVIAIIVGILIVGRGSSDAVPPGEPRSTQRPQPTCPVTSGICQ
jgi:hypothetical protein